MKRTIATIEGCDICEFSDGRVSFTAGARIDSDGSGPHHGDKWAQGDTSLHYNGKPLNADVDCFIVAPPQVVRGVRGIVLGCQARVEYRGKIVAAVVGDVGPHARVGEISVALAKALGINPSPNSGGVDEHVVKYDLWPGTPAEVNGVKYALQAS